MKNLDANKKVLRFPDNFYWGTATSSHQIEGNNKNNDWWRAEQKGELPHKSGLACDSYNRYEEDFDLAKEMHNNAHRLSIEWSRIEPREGEFDKKEIEHYRKVIRALKERGLEPFVTLHHFTNPLWFADKGGWENKKSPQYFARYAQYVVKNIPEVKYWITVNEPNIVINGGYGWGDWPPFKGGRVWNMIQPLKNMASAHNLAYKKIYTANSSCQVGIAHSVNYFHPMHEQGPLYLVDSLRVIRDRFFKNYYFLNKIKKQQDFIGLNYYNHRRTHFWYGKRNENKEVSDFGWEIYPEGIYHVAKEIWQKYKKPIYIFENGIADADDDQRPKFIKDHLGWLYKAIEEGADVRGYFYWSLLDNFEWAEGFTMRFGLVEVDFSTQGGSASGGKILKRTPRDSYYAYKEICRNNAII